MQARFVAMEDGFRLDYAGRTLLAHTAARPAFTFGVGVPDVQMYRGNFQITDQASDFPALTVAAIAPQSIRMVGEGGFAVELTLTGTDTGFDFSIVTSEATPPTALPANAPGARCNRISVALEAAPDEHIWGGGEQLSYLCLNGRKFPMWTSEPGVGRDKARELTRIMDAEGMAGGDYWTTNYPQPTFLSSAQYACHLGSSAWSALDFSDPARHRIEVWEGNLTLEFLFAGSMADLVSALSTRFGRAAPLPEWAISGAIIGLKQGAASFERLEKIRSAGAAVSGLWCEDWVGIRETSFGRRLFWDWRWRADRYPDLPAQIARLHADGIRFLGYVNPYLAIDGTQYAEAAERGFLALRQNEDAPYIVDFGEFDCGIVDFTNPDAADWFAERIIGKEMLDFGLSGWMADFGEYLPTDLRLHDGSDPMLAHNHWPVLWARVNARAIAARGKTADAMFFMRAGFTGVQAQCPLLWAGDQCVDFSRHDGIGTVITAALSSGLVGNVSSHSDVGGYTSLHGVTRTPELLMRWAELGAFTPVMRTHEGNRPDDNLQVDSTAEILDHFAAMTRVHAALAPYMRALVAEGAATGLPLQRALFLHYPANHDYACCQDQFLLGPDLMVAPVIEQGATSRQVLLPAEDSWIHVWSGETFSGGTHLVHAPLGSPPVFARHASPYAAVFAALAQARGPIAEGTAK